MIEIFLPTVHSISMS